MILTEQYNFGLPSKNVPWDREYNNVPHFQDQASLLSYLGLGKDDFGSSNSRQGVNLAFDSSSETRPVIIDLEEVSGTFTMERALQLNYLVAQEILTNGAVKYLFFFITEATEVNYHTVSYRLELDLFQTFMVGTDWHIDSAMMKRLHRNRWTSDSKVDNLNFNLTNGAPANHPDELSNQPAPLYPAVFQSLDEDPLNPTLKDYVRGWVCLWYNATSDTHSKSQQTIFQNSQGFGYKIPLFCVFAPIMVEGKKLGFAQAGNDRFLGFYEGNNCDWTARDFAFYGNEEMQTYDPLPTTGNTCHCPLVSITFTKYCPAGHLDVDGTLFKTQDVILIEDETRYTFNLVRTAPRGVSDNNNPFLYLPTIRVFQDNLLKTDTLIDLKENLNIKTKFLFTNLDLLRDETMEPKLLSSPFLRITLNNYQTTGSLTFNAFDLGEASFYISGFEFPYPTGTFEFSTLVPYNTETVTSDFFRMMKGISFTSIYELPKVDDNYLTYLRNNKNAIFTGFIQPTTEGTEMGILGAAVGVAVGKAAATIAGGAIGAAIGVIGGVASYVANEDNLKNSEKKISQLTTSPAPGIWGPSSLFDYLEVWKPVPAIQKTIFDTFFRVGYEVDAIVPSSEWFGRYRFNFVQTSAPVVGLMLGVGNDAAKISNENKTVMSDALQRGITFWEMPVAGDEDDKRFFGDVTHENWEKEIVYHG